VILFEDFTIPAIWESDARKLMNTTEDQAISRLISTNAFATVARKQSLVPDDPYLVVKCTLTEYRMVSHGVRYLVGGLAGTSFFIFRAQVYDGKSGELLFQRKMSSETNGGTFTRRADLGLPKFMGNMLADYLALRARKDKGVNVLPLEPLTQTGTGKPR
ncbi:MAG TPA: hypothetical protein VKF63_04095, partial [Terracidiphilus sp.]|nr:hypothetical protein [Terracidiphilus sp.]